MKCLNCHAEIDQNDKFCSQCGQQVDKNNLSLGVLIQEFFENYISLDTRFGRSIKPFLFKPGFLSLEFNSGIRKNYANPFRLYILTSILFFSGFSYYMVQKNENNAETGVRISTDNSELVFSDLDSTQNAQLNRTIKPDIINYLNRNNDSSFSNAVANLPPNARKELEKSLSLDHLSSIKNVVDSIPSNSGPDLNFNAGSTGINFNVGDLDWQLMEKHKFNRQISDEALLDSMNYENMSSFNRFLSLQTIRIYRAGQKEVVRFILKNLSLVMLLLIPLSGLLLMLFFRKNKLKYVEHLILTVHMHSFAFLLLGIGYLLSVVSSESIGTVIRVLASVFILIYFFKALKNFYKRTWFKTISRGIFLNIFYFFISLLFFLIEVFVSFLLY